MPRNERTSAPVGCVVRGVGAGPKAATPATRMIDAPFLGLLPGSQAALHVTIIEARSLIHARLKATLAGQNGGMVFTEGHMLSAEMAQLVQPEQRN
jgi:hypothetical protein